MTSSTTHPEFGLKTTATEAANAFSENIKGKTIIITGVSPNSLGEALGFALASQSPHLLIFASRTPSKLHLVTTKILSAFPSVSIQEVQLDLSSQKNVRLAANEITTLVQQNGKGKIDVLFNNAGINVNERRLTPEGIELQFGTNHIGHFLLTNLLLPLLLHGEGRGNTQPRIVNTSSEAHRISPVRFSDYNQDPGRKLEREDEPRRGLPKGFLRGGGRYEPAVAYGMSKTANVLFSVGLNERLAGLGVRSFAVMPGTILTDLVREADNEGMKNLLANTQDWKNADQGAATLVVAAFDPALNAELEVYLDDCQMKRPSKWASDPQKAERLWKLSEQLVGEKFSSGKESRL